MKTVVFSGPTLSSDEVLSLLPNATVRGPAGFGDVYEAWLAGYARIVLIDGYFDQRQPVWHKELLFVLWRGCQVHGAASMGALRAVELARYGMRGFGSIYHAYRTGVLEADDEVVVAHESSESGYRATSVALINIRATLGTAVTVEVISAEVAARLSTVAESLFYTERNYRTLLQQARAVIGETDLTRFARFIETRKVDIKQQDARGLLEHLRTSAAEPQQPRTEFLFNETDAWLTFQKSFQQRQHHSR